MRFGRKRQYSYYSSYSSSRRSRFPWNKVIIIVLIIVICLGVLVWFNFNRIQLMMKGYSFSQQNSILSLESKDVSEILSHDKMDHIQEWIDDSKNVSFYDEYEQYYLLNKDVEVKTIISTIDDMFTNYVPKLETLGYSQKQIWEILKTANQRDLAYLIEHQFSYAQIEPYMQVKGFKFTDMDKYMKKYKEKNNYNYAVLFTTYPFIISTNEPTTTYTIQDPENILALVKKGFQLPSNYEPKDLVVPDMPIAPDCDNPKMRKEAADALVEMYDAAKKEGYSLVINSAYRSYQEQTQTYQSFEKRWGGIYAKEHVALPGCSEHQTGLGVDLTSESVVKKEKLVFGDTEEYKWVVKNAYRFGFILRFADGTSDITGIVHEPWHFRYVGKDVAKVIYDNNWTFEDYCLNEGVIPNIKEN